MDGDVTVRVSHSTLNYKDGLAVTGKAPVVRRFPMIPGVDFAGIVESVLAPGLQARRRGHPQRLGLGRNPSRRLCGEGAGERRMADPAAAGPFRSAGHGHRHCGLHGDAVPDGFGAAWASPGSRSGDRDRRRRRRRLGRRGAARQGRLARDRLDRAAGGGGLSERSRRRRDPRPQRARRAVAGRSPRSAGRPASTPSARRRSPMFCR